MKIVKPKATIWDWDDPIKHIARCASICYKSGVKEDPEKFVASLINKGHLSVLDHASVMLDEELDWNVNKYLFEGNNTSCGNIRAWLEGLGNNPEITLEYIKDLYTHDDLIIRKEELYASRELHHITVHFVMDRTISHQLVRHGDGAGVSQESQRYCNYSKGKFGNEITVVEPIWYSEGGDKANVWTDLCNYSEIAYFEMLLAGAKPEQARKVLPNSTKTEVVFTTRIEHWEHIFKERCSKAADPDMRALMIPLREEFIERGYLTFSGGNK